MHLSDWESVAGVVTTLAVGLPVYLLKHDSPPRKASVIITRTGRDTISQNVNISQRQSSKTSIYYTTEQEDDPTEALVVAVVGLLVVTAGYWAARPYLLVGLVALFAWTAAMSVAEQQRLRIIESRAQSVRLAAALTLIGGDLLLLAYPGLVWGNGLQFSWTFKTAVHVHGLNFAFSSVFVLAATVIGLLLLAIRCVTILVEVWALRWAHVKRGTIPKWLVGQLHMLGCQSDASWMAIIFAVTGLIVAIAAPHFPTNHMRTL